MIIDKISLQEIPENTKFDGYLWMSDATDPEIFENQLFTLKVDKKSNPFIVEGYLFDQGNMVSYSLKYIDGEYFIHKYTLGNNKHFTELEFLANRMPEKQHLFFRQYWEAVPDECCEEMEVLKPKANVFVGFKNL
jgi:CRISPR type III-associated protein (TIGR04423 family)